jgi:hypothetical protein
LTSRRQFPGDNRQLSFPAGAARIASMRDDPSQLLLQVKITIADIEPAIWRRLLLPKELNFAQLHEIIQAAFSWTDSHLHQFNVGGLVVGAPEFDEDGLNDHQIFEASEIFLRDLDLYHLPDPTILYECDFGDSWRHWIAFETSVERVAGQKYPLIVGGARAGPPEDCGGPHGYDDFLEAWRDPDHEENRAMRRWAPRGFDPEAFDRDKTQKAVLSALRRCRGGYRFRLEP